MILCCGVRGNKYGFGSVMVTSSPGNSCRTINPLSENLHLMEIM